MLKGFNKSNFPIKKETDKAIQFAIPYIMYPKEGGKLTEPRQMTLGFWVPKSNIDQDGNIPDWYVNREVENVKKFNRYIDLSSVKKSFGEKLKK